MAELASTLDGLPIARLVAGGRPGPKGVTLTGRQKAAILLVTLGPSAPRRSSASSSEEEIESLSLEMAKTRYVPPDLTEGVMEEAVEMTLAADYVGHGGYEYAREVLEKTLGPARAAEIMGRLSVVIEARPFEFLRRTPPEQICAFLRNEAPQTMALTIANLHTTLAAEVLAQLQPETQADVAMRIATMNETSPDVISEVEGVMKQKLASVISQEYAMAGGVDSLVEILNRSDRATERNVLDQLAETRRAARRGDPDDAVRLRGHRQARRPQRPAAPQGGRPEGPRARTARRLRRGARQGVTNMSQRAAEMLLEEIEYQPPQLRRVVEEAQGRIVAKVRQLEESEAIVITRAGADGDDELVA